MEEDSGVLTALNFTMSEAYNSTENRCVVHPTAKNLVLSIVLTLICVVAFFGNAAVLVTVACYRSLHSVTYVLLMSLAIADLLVSMFSMPWRIHQTIRNNQWCLSLELCAFWIWIDSFACCASITNLAMVGIERFIAIKCPLRYTMLMDRGNSFMIVTFVWLYSVIWASLGNLNWSDPATAVFYTNHGCGKYDPIYYTVVSVFAFYLPLTVVVVTYSYLTNVAISHARALQNFVSPEHGRPRSSTIIRARTAMFKREIKATKMMATVVGAFFICWFPFFVLVLKSLWSPSKIHPLVAEFTSILFVTVLPNLNSALNPFIYIAYTRELRQAAGKLLARLKLFLQCRYDVNDNPRWASRSRNTAAMKSTTSRTVEWV